MFSVIGREGSEPYGTFWSFVSVVVIWGIVPVSKMCSVVWFV